MTIDKSKTQNSPFGVNTSTATANLRQTFNNTQNWTVPAGVNGIWVHLTGGGAGGTSKSTTNNSNGQGGVGGNGVFGYTPVTPGSTVGITIGAGGAGGTIGASINEDQIYGGAGGRTDVNTVGTCWSAGGGQRGGVSNLTNTEWAQGFSGKMLGVSRQQLVFGQATNSPRIVSLYPQGSNTGTRTSREGVGVGGLVGPASWNGNASQSFRSGGNSHLGGAAGGSSVTNISGAGGGGNGGNQGLTGYTGGAGAAYVSPNSGGGGGGAGIAGNGGAASGNNGGTGGAGGGGGGGGGGNNATTGCSAGAGGAGAVLIYY